MRYAAGIEQELARRLHAASVAEVTIERTVAARELSRFCQDLVRCGERGAGKVDLIELLGEHGVERIVLRPAYRPEVLNVGAAAPTVASLIEQQPESFDGDPADPARQAPEPNPADLPKLIPVPKTPLPKPTPPPDR